ncbi:MAG: hypothetical protein GY927_21950 [bacterium]|nr:hypothetical protein [bacterium]
MKPETLQTWVNRNVIELADHNPGRGRQRHYSPIDVVKLAIMRRTDNLNIGLNVARDWAEGAAEELLKNGEISWDFYLIYNPRMHNSPDPTVIYSGGRLSGYGPTVCDPRSMSIESLSASHIERRDRRNDWDELRRAEKAVKDYRKDTLRNTVQSVTDQKTAETPEERKERIAKDSVLSLAADPRPMNPDKREYWARMGIHAEPVIPFPLGEIVNGTLAQLRAIDEENDNA